MAEIVDGENFVENLQIFARNQDELDELNADEPINNHIGPNNFDDWYENVQNPLNESVSYHLERIRFHLGQIELIEVIQNRDGRIL